VAGVVDVGNSCLTVELRLVITLKLEVDVGAVAVDIAGQFAGLFVLRSSKNRQPSAILRVRVQELLPLQSRIALFLALGRPLNSRRISLLNPSNNLLLPMHNHIRRMIDPQRRLAVIVQSEKRLLDSDLHPQRNRIQPILAAPRLVQNNLQPLDVCFAFAFDVFDDSPGSSSQFDDGLSPADSQFLAGMPLFHDQIPQFHGFQILRLGG
jgi:hypothetical protein